ncbi:hypothetical protein EDB84DRAFT_1563781 [Lactarius hengduanensis]|nr:hypothetical protein EDB84DRAFT_1563781 [Lactarius hengduanensis]
MDSDSRYFSQYYGQYKQAVYDNLIAGIIYATVLCIADIYIVLYVASVNVLLPSPASLNAHSAQIRRAWSSLPEIKGSVNALLPQCKFYSIAEDSTPALGTDMRSVIASKAQVAAACELRVLAMTATAVSSWPPPYRTPLHSPACRLPPRVTPMSGSSNSGLGFEEKEKVHLVFMGFVVMLDPLRNGVADAMVLLQSGGVQVAVITGDMEEPRCWSLVAWGRGSVSDGRYTSARRCARIGWTLRKEAADAILMDDNVLPTVEKGTLHSSSPDLILLTYNGGPDSILILPGTASSGPVDLPLVMFLLRLASEREDPDKMAVHGGTRPAGRLGTRSLREPAKETAHEHLKGTTLPAEQVAPSELLDYAYKRITALSRHAHHASVVRRLPWASCPPPINLGQLIRALDTS